MKIETIEIKNNTFIITGKTKIKNVKNIAIFCTVVVMNEYVSLLVLFCSCILILLSENSAVARGNDIAINNKIPICTGLHLV